MLLPCTANDVRRLPPPPLAHSLALAGAGFVCTRGTHKCKAGRRAGGWGGWGLGAAGRGWARKVGARIGALGFARARNQRATRRGQSHRQTAEGRGNRGILFFWGARPKKGRKKREMLKAVCLP